MALQPASSALTSRYSAGVGARFKLHIYLLLLAVTLVAPRGALAVNAGGELREEFQQSYPLSPGGQVHVSNSVGKVRVQAWDRNDVRVYAVKRAYHPNKLAEAQIEVDAGLGSITVRTRYPGGTIVFQTGSPDSSAAVDYVITVPRGAGVTASSQSGDVSARGLSGRVKLSSMSGDVEAVFDQVAGQGHIKLESMSGSVTVTLPANTNADLRASSTSAEVESDFEVADGGRVRGEEVSARLGAGGTVIQLSSMSGPVRIRRGAGSPPNSVYTPEVSARPLPAPPPRDTTPPRIQIISPQVERGVGVSPDAKRIAVVGRAFDPSGVSEVLVSGVRARLDRDGNFSAEIALAAGRNKITVAATDTYGNSAVEEFTISRPAATPAPPVNSVQSTRPSLQPADAMGRRYYAIVIGNNDYQFQERLKTAVNDAKAVEKILREDFGFETALLLNAGRDEIIEKLNDYRRKLDDTSNLVIYYAGHGIYDREADKAYWLPVDARPDKNVKWVSADDVTTNIRAIPARQVLVISDSCYSGLISGTGETRAARVALPAPERERYIQKMLTGRSRLLMTSGGNEPVSDGGSQGHSVFASAFLNGLKQMEQPVFTAEELFYTYIRESVAGRSEQTPHYSPIRNSGHDRGDFIFFRRR